MHPSHRSLDFRCQLLALGAPADLIAQAHRAMGDEIEHARLCFGLAAAYHGESRVPTALDVSECMTTHSLRPIEIAWSLVTEGCIAETVSAWLQARVPIGLNRRTCVEHRRWHARDWYRTTHICDLKSARS